MPRDPRRDPRKGDQLYIHAGNARRIVIDFDGVVVRYSVGAHAYTMPIADWRVRMVGAILATPRVEYPVSP